jgi:UV DNA damage repair endonuclease
MMEGAAMEGVFFTNLYLSILLHYITYNILSLFRLSATIYTILSFHDYHTKYNNMQHKWTRPAGAASKKQQEHNMNTAART